MDAYYYMDSELDYGFDYEPDFEDYEYNEHNVEKLLSWSLEEEY